MGTTSPVRPGWRADSKVRMGSLAVVGRTASSSSARRALHIHRSKRASASRFSVSASPLRDVAGQGALERFNALWILHAAYTEFEEDPQRALEVLERLRALYPDFFDTWLVLAYHHFYVSDPPDRKRGLAILERGLQRFDDGEYPPRAGEELRLGLSRAYVGDLRPQTAAEVARPVLQAVRGREEREFDAAFVLVRALNRSGAHDEATRILGDLRQRYPESERLQRLQRMVEAYDDDVSRAYLAASAPWRVGRDGDVEAAQTRFRELLAGEHPAGVIRFCMASMYFDLDDRAAAAEHYRAMLEVGVERPSWYTPRLPLPVNGA